MTNKMISRLAEVLMLIESGTKNRYPEQCLLDLEEVHALAEAALAQFSKEKFSTVSDVVPDPKATWI